MAATGEVSFNLNEQQVNKFDRSPATPGEHPLKVIGQRARVGQKDEPGAVPYVSFPLEVLDEKQQDSDRNKWQWHMLFLSMKPSDKDGVAMPTRQAQLLDFAKGLGISLPAMSTANGWIKAHRDSKGQIIHIIAPEKLIAWLKTLDGRELAGVLKMKKGSNGHSDSTQIDYFVEADSEGGDAFSEPTAEEASEEAQAEDGAFDEAPVAEEEVEETPPPPPPKQVARVTQAPAKGKTQSKPAPKRR